MLCAGFTAKLAGSIASPQPTHLSMASLIDHRLKNQSDRAAVDRRSHCCHSWACMIMRAMEFISGSGLCSSISIPISDRSDVAIAIASPECERLNIGESFLERALRNNLPQALAVKRRSVGSTASHWARIFLSAARRKRKRFRCRSKTNREARSCSSELRISSVQANCEVSMGPINR